MSRIEGTTQVLFRWSAMVQARGRSPSLSAMVHGGPDLGRAMIIALWLIQRAMGVSSSAMVAHLDLVNLRWVALAGGAAQVVHRARQARLVRGGDLAQEDVLAASSRTQKSLLQKMKSSTTGKMIRALGSATQASDDLIFSGRSGFSRFSPSRPPIYGDGA